MIADLNLHYSKDSTANDLMLVCGPCSAESEDQIMNTARAIAKLGKVDYFRAGIWKPRTRPSGFEGVGDIGLNWLKKVKLETGLKLTTEVATPAHVEKAVEAGVDMLWIGARTVGNPFSVEEIANSLKGTSIPIMVKNPLNPDLKLWLGAIERINRVGVEQIMAVHRGFFTSELSRFRHQPLWEIPIELKRLAPHLKLIADPSHICGNTSIIPEISQKAIDLGVDGLMLEVHENPREALTDAKQQLTPLELDGLLDQLVYRRKSVDQGIRDQLADLRGQIDQIDKQLLIILARRMDVVKELGAIKNEKNITVLQLERWREMIKDRLSNAESMGLDDGFILRLLQMVHKQSIQIQTQIFNDLERKKD